jgi:enamine deaminase RidA (YjgF/YER057c/UK114 family)
MTVPRQEQATGYWLPATDHLPWTLDFGLWTLGFRGWEELVMDVYEKLRELNIELPETPNPVAAYVPAVISGGLVFASGQTPTVGGKLVYRGKVGAEVSEEDGHAAARIAALNCVAELRWALGDLRRVKRIVRLTGYVASAPGFERQPMVVNGASELMLELWGDAGQHARTSIGVAELPSGAPVEIELIAELAE